MTLHLHNGKLIDGIIKEECNALERIFDGPKSGNLYKKLNEIFNKIDNLYLDTKSEELFIDEKLLLEAVSYFKKKYVSMVNELLGTNSELHLIGAEVYSNENIESVIEMIKSYNKDIKKIINISYTDYQEAALKFLDENRGKNNLVIMPTGYGKTIVAFNEILKQIKSGKKVVFSAPTNDLVNQQYEEFLDYLKYIVGENDYVSEVVEGLDSSKKVCFVTNHKLQEGVESGVFDENNFYVVDEVHEGEGKESEEREHKYPSFKAFEKLKGKNYNLLSLSATPGNIKVLKGKMGIEKIFNGSNRKFYIPKNRKFEFSEKSNLFSQLELHVNSQIDIDLETISFYINDVISKNIFTNEKYNIIKKYSKDNLKNITYIDSEEIKLFEKIFNKKENKEFFSSLWKLKKVLEIRKKLYEGDYKNFINYMFNQVSNLKTKKQYIINNNLWLFSLFDIVVSEFENNKDQINNHPKLNTLFNILDSKKDNKKTVFVHVENEDLIKDFIELVRKKGLNASYFKGGNKNKNQEFVDSYTKENIRNGNLDVVFVTSVFKLGMNYDIEDFIFYHPPKNKKDLLQFEGRVGRYSKNANIYYLGIEGGFEASKVHKTVNNANSYLEKQFDYADEFLSMNNQELFEGSKNIYEKKGKKKKEEISVSDLLDKNINTGEFIFSRFKLFKKFGIYRDKFDKYYLSLYFVDSSSNRGINVNLYYSGRLEKEEKKVKALNDLANELSEGRIYSLSGKINYTNNEDVIISLKYDNPSQMLNGMNENSYDSSDYIYKQETDSSGGEKIEFDHFVHRDYNNGKNYMTGSLFEVA